MVIESVNRLDHAIRPPTSLSNHAAPAHRRPPTIGVAKPLMHNQTLSNARTRIFIPKSGEMRDDSSFRRT